jgi:hypothetical protein
MRVALTTAMVAVLVLAPGRAVADVLDLYDNYRATGAVRACEHSAEELRAAVADVPADIRAYDPGFVDALDTALDRRAAGCAGTPAEVREDDGAITAADGAPGPASPVRPLRPVSGSPPERAPLALAFGAVALLVGGSLAAAAGLGRREGRR